jgi:cell division protein FtsW
LRLNEFHFLWLHLRWLPRGSGLFVSSLLPRRRRGVRRAAVRRHAVRAAPRADPRSEVNGARRWLNLGFSFQPSEFLKPAFAVGLAWILAWRVRDPNLPVIPIATAMMGVVAALLMVQPDFGATMLFGGVWFVLVLLSGLPCSGSLSPSPA